MNSPSWLIGSLYSPAESAARLTLLGSVSIHVSLTGCGTVIQLVGVLDYIFMPMFRSSGFGGAIGVISILPIAASLLDFQRPAEPRARHQTCDADSVVPALMALCPYRLC